MQTAYFESFCPYEIGDKVEVVPYGKIYTVVNIRAIHYVSSGKVEFELFFDNHPGRRWVSVDEVIKRIEEC